MSAEDRGRAVDAAVAYLGRMFAVAKVQGVDACFPEMLTNVDAIRERLCKAAPQGDRECNRLEELATDLARSRAQHDASEADETHDPDLRRRAADEFFAVARAHCLGEHPAPRCDEIVFNAAILYLRADDRRDAEAVRALFRDPENALGGSSLVRKLDCMLAGITDDELCR